MGDPFARLGVRAFINCAGVRTIHGNSTMLPEVRAAVDDAADHFVFLDELMEAVGARLAALTGAEWGIVAPGSAAALTLAAAGCIAGNDPDRMLALPDARGMAHRVLVPPGQRFVYDHALRVAGGTVEEVADEAALRAALAAGGVALICLLAARDAESPLPCARIVPLARAALVPLLVDAASEFPDCPDPWLARGADLAVYSGGKYLRGPAASGLLIGRAALVRAAWANSSPHQAVGRPLKMGKEQIVGTLVAVERWFARDRAAEVRRWDADLAIIAAAATAAGAAAEPVAPPGPGLVPRLRVRWTRPDLAGLALRQALLDGAPRILVEDMWATADSVTIDPFGLRPGEAAEVGRALAAALAAPALAPPPPAPPLAVAGTWRATLAFLHGRAPHEFSIAQEGRRLTGLHRADAFTAELEGEIAGGAITLASRHRREGIEITYGFAGEAVRDRMAGSFRVGGNGDANRGPVAERQFGTGTWTAERSGA